MSPRAAGPGREPRIRPLRVCMATTFYPPWSFGGDGIQVRRLAHALADRGHEVTVVHSREGYQAMAGHRPTEPEDDHPGVRVVGIAARGGRLSPLATYLTGRPLLAGRRLAAALDEPFDVVHFHNPSLLGGPEALMLGGGIKLYTAHEQWLVCPTHVLYKYGRRVCEKPDCVRCTLVHGRPPQLWRSTGLLERSLAHLDALICPSATSRRLHERFGEIVRLEQLPHFVPDPGVGAEGKADPRAGGEGAADPGAGDEGAADPGAGDEAATDPGASAEGAGGAGRRPYFLYAGRLEPIKGVDALLRAWSAPGRAQDLVIAGEGTLEPRLRAQAAGLPGVRFLGRLAPDHLDALYRGALAVLVPTAGHESFGLVAIEAFARGTPVVARDFGALGELLADSGAGLPFATGAELRAALDRLAADAPFRAELGRRARAAFEARYTEDAHIEGYFAIIREAAQGREAAQRRVATS